MTRHAVRTLWLLLGAAGLCSPAAAQTGEPPTGRAVRIERPPVIDGRLDEGVWERAPLFSGFRQQEPVEGEPASEETRVHILYDEARLYIGIEALDGDPGQIRASELRRDNTLESDDSFSILFDTYHDHRNAFLFRINPRGTRFDAIVRNESRFLNADWDEQWTAAAVITDRGWSAEVVVPFKVLRFSGAAEQTWGVNFERVIKRKNELVYWAGWNRNYAFTHVSQAGHLVGLKDIKQAERLRIRPYAVMGAERLDAVPAPDGTTLLREVGIDDLKFAVTSNLTADLAVNPDFAQTEVDAQRVNLTRFSLFFPEKRQFFIEGADSLRMGVGLLHFGPPPLELFYSRSVGLSPAGEPIPVAAGGKMTGKAGGFDLGVLNVQTARGPGRAGENFGVARFRKEVLGRSYFGGIVTSRQGDGAYNRVVGTDGRFVFRQYFHVMGLAARSFSTGAGGPQWARQLGAEWRDDFIDAGVNYLKVDPGFQAGVGFVRRRDRLLGGRASLKPRPGGTRVRQFEITPSAVWYHDRDGVLRTRELQLRFNTAFQTGDRIELTAENLVEHLPRRFLIGPNVTLPVARYEWNNATLQVRTFNGRAVSGTIRGDAGSFYNGTKRSVELAGELRPGKNLSLNPSYAFNDVNLLQGAFDTHLFGLRANVSFTTNLLTSAYLQYNSSGELAALQVRLNYIFRTIDNVYVVFNETRFTGGVFADEANRSLVVKVTYSVHR